MGAEIRDSNLFFSENKYAIDKLKELGICNLDDYKKMYIRYFSALKELETRISVYSLELSLLRNDLNPICEIKTRLKSLSSIIEKAERKGFEPTIDNIEKNIKDIAGMRVICTNTAPIYGLLNCLETQPDLTIEEIQDYIKEPKESGYRSLHILVSVPVRFLRETKKLPVEMQLRTMPMDVWANFTHQIDYKKEANGKNRPEIERLIEESTRLTEELDDVVDRAYRLFLADQRIVPDSVKIID